MIKSINKVILDLELYFLIKIGLINQLYEIYKYDNSF